MLNIITMITNPQNAYEKVFFVIIIIIFSTVLLRLITYTLKHLKRKTEIDMTLPYLIRDLLQYIIYFVAIILILDIYGINVQGILVSIGIVGIIIGFAAKDIISNFMSGMFLVTDKTIKVGDEIVVENVKGVVTDITFRKLTLLTADNVVVTVPNSLLSSKVYKNNTNEHTVKLTLPILINHSIDTEDFERKVIMECEKFDFVLNKKNNKLVVLDINEFGVNGKLSIEITDKENMEKYRLIIANTARKVLNEMANKDNPKPDKIQ